MERIQAKAMKVSSLFDGISCARVALGRAGFKVEKYYASEVDKYAIQIAQKNYPNTIQLGGVENILTGDWTEEPLENIDLLIGGSPCQDLSVAKRDRKGLDGEHSGLFWEYVRILREIEPKYFILENVASMPQKDKEIIIEALGVEPIMINAALVSAQNRKRLFWTNIPNVGQPKDRGILLQDILETEVEMEHFIKDETLRNLEKGNKPQSARIRNIDGKSCTLQAGGGGTGAKTGLYRVESGVRKLTPIECERLQGLPDNYTEGISDTQRYKTLGNAFNVDVVAHILSFIPKQ